MWKKGSLKLLEAVSKSGTQMQRVYKAGRAYGSAKFNSNRKGPEEVRDQLDRIQTKARKLALKDPDITPKLKRKLRTVSDAWKYRGLGSRRAVSDTATEKAAAKGIARGRAHKEAYHKWRQERYPAGNPPKKPQSRDTAGNPTKKRQSWYTAGNPTKK